MSNIKVAEKLQEILGGKYTVIFDDCESGLTRVFYKASNGEKILVKEVLNSEIKANIVISEFELSKEKRFELMAKGIL